jgi:hypothetical protein
MVGAGRSECFGTTTGPLGSISAARPGEIPVRVAGRTVNPKAVSKGLELDMGFNRATLKSRSERGQPDLSDLQVDLWARILGGDVRRRPERASAYSAVAPPSERKCAPPSLLDNGIGTAKSQCGWLSGPQRFRRSRSQCTRTDNKTVLVPVGASFTVSGHQLSRLQRRSHRR